MRPGVFPALVLLSLAGGGCGRENPRLLTGSGIIEVTEVVVRSKVMGRVSSLGFDEGLPVEAGQVLARLAADELGAQERQALSASATARQQVTLAENDLRLAEDSYGRNKPLFDSGMLSEQAFYQIESRLRASRSQLESARGGLAQAQAGLSLVRAQLSGATIIAPVSGTALERNIEVGELAMAGTAICKIGDLTRPYLRIYVPEGRYGRVQLDQPARVFVNSHPGKAFPGRVAVIADQAEFTPKDVQTREERTKLVFAVKIALDNPQALLKPGMPADAEIDIQ
jgi:HlyD family secretion protein